MKVVSKIRQLFKRKNKAYERQLSLIKVGTFKTGDKIYTYRQEDLHLITYRHYRNISETQAYLEAFGQTKAEWQIAINQMREAQMKAIDNHALRTDTLVNNIKYLDHFQQSVNGIRDSNKMLEDQMLCMFYLLDGEESKGYNESINEKKLQLFDDEPELRAFFLSKLSEVSEFYKVISKKDLLKLLMDLQKVQNIQMSMN